jgi:hypothetical protein
VVASATAANLVVNGDFEDDTDGFIAWPGYVSNGGNPPDVPFWSGTGGGRGINPINNPNERRDLAPFRDNGDNDTSVAFMQGAATLEQEVTGFVVGKQYVLQLDYNSRICCNDFPQVEMTLDGELFEDFPDPDLFVDGIVEPVRGFEPWYYYESTFTAANETMLLSISSRPSVGGDASFLLDNISIDLAPTANVPLAGDADLDRDFDQVDLVKVQIAAKYLSGQTATWGDGDWNGAPDPASTFQNPPAGDRLFNQLDIIAALGAGTYLRGPYAAIGRGGRPGDAQTSIIYNVNTGELAVDAPAGTQLTSINVDSAASIFTGAPAQNLGGSFDNDANNNIFKATFGSSFGSLSFGNVAQAGLSEAFVAGDLSVVGSLSGGGALGNVDLIYIPEPSAILLAAFGILMVLVRRQW